MSVQELVAALFRRWYVVVLGILLTAGALFWIRGLPGVYFAQVNVVFLAPSEGIYNPLSTTTRSLVSTAGVVARAVAGADARYQPTAEGVTLLDEGITHGHSVRLPNAGGQWDYRFDEPVLDVQAAGRTLAEAEAEMSDALTQIEQTLTMLEDRAGVAEGERILTRLSPSEPVFRYDDGSRLRALGAAGLIGALITCIVAVATDARVRSRAAVNSDLAEAHPVSSVR